MAVTQVCSSDVRCVFRWASPHPFIFFLVEWRSWCSVPLNQPFLQSDSWRSYTDIPPQHCSDNCTGSESPVRASTGWVFLVWQVTYFSDFFFFPSFSFFHFKQLHVEKFVLSCYPCKKVLKRNFSRRVMHLLVKSGSTLVSPVITGALNVLTLPSCQEQSSPGRWLRGSCRWLNRRWSLIWAFLSPHSLLLQSLLAASQPAGEYQESNRSCCRI